MMWWGPSHTSPLQSHTKWEDLGPFVKHCDSLTDWFLTTDKNVWQSRSTGFYKQSLSKHIKGFRTVEVLCDFAMIKNEEMSIPEGLQ